MTTHLADQGRVTAPEMAPALAPVRSMGGFEVAFAPDTRLIGDARQTTTEFLRQRGFPDGVVDAAELIVSELVTNAIVHGCPDGTGTVTLHVGLVEHGAVGIRVRDQNPEPARLTAASEDALGGRGLHLVDALSDTWHVSPDGRSTVATISTPAEIEVPAC
ncbi:ATP-binding protein [Streptomyces sp. NPDC048718]|uniref:ATP-binding protein n=1 Tax=Streptomyces sp. NPDC048718 TaxID=3365587 RepID=UPI00371773FA